jgi:hypothetical protein
MSYLPIDPADPTLDTPRHRDRAVRLQQKTELSIHQHGMAARFRAEVDRLDSQALSDALRVSLDEEVTLLDYGLSRAGQSAAKVELVTRKVEMLSTINNRRIQRRFGG